MFCAALQKGLCTGAERCPSREYIIYQQDAEPLGNLSIIQGKYVIHIFKPFESRLIGLRSRKLPTHQKFSVGNAQNFGEASSEAFALIVASTLLFKRV
jgi:hypothetical protein